MSMEIKHIEAVLTLASKELDRGYDEARAGALMCLLREAVPYLRDYVSVLKSIKERAT